MHFEQAGRENTEQTLKLAYERGKELGLNEVVLATSTGDTAYRAIDIFSGFSIIAVTYHGGFRKPFENVIKAEVRKDLESKGIIVHSATHALSGVERSINKKYQGLYPALLIADTLRRFGQGTKVAVEVAIMATDGGLLTGNDIVSIGGSGRGADTAWVLTPVNQNDFFDLKMKELICKPKDW